MVTCVNHPKGCKLPIITEPLLFSRYRVDELAREKGHEVIRLPPYHCDLNPIEKVWAYEKGYVARHNWTQRAGKCGAFCGFIDLF